MAMTEKHAESATAKIQSMLKLAAKEDDAWNTTWFPYNAYVWTDKQGRQISSDNYRSFRLNDPLDLPEISDAKKDKLILFRNAIERGFEACEKRKQFRLDTPDIATLKLRIALCNHLEKANNDSRKARIKPFVSWNFGAGFPLVNARYLIDLLTILPDAVLYTISPYKAIKAPIYAVSVYGDAILMPALDKAKHDEIDAQGA